MLPRCAFVVAACVAATLSLSAQRPQIPIFRGATDLTMVTATVRTSGGRLVPDLTADAFEIYEDGVRQTISHFTGERVPVSLAVLLDASDSMYGQRLRDARQAIAEFVTHLIDRGDEYAIIAFNHKQSVLSDWTDDGARATEVMAPLQPWGATAIYDAILATLPLAEIRHRQRAALLVLSDGADTASDATLREVQTELQRSEAFVYAVAIDPKEKRPINAPVNAGALSAITDQSGGRTAVVHTSAEIGAALTDIADELNHQYLLGYSSSRAADGKFHSIRVRVRDGNLRVRARNGYVATPTRR